MSNIGKSQFAARLESELGYLRYECDELIEEELQIELQKGGFKGIRDLARWMGQPFEERYRSTSSQYLAAEKAVLLSCLYQLESNRKQTVIDTTGSVIYLAEEALQKLSSKSVIVYLKADQGSLERLFDKYVQDPKPVIWGDEFKPLPGEAAPSALARCYPSLVAFRAERYAKLADVELEFSEHRDPYFSLKELEKLISRIKK